MSDGKKTEEFKQELSKVIFKALKKASDDDGGRDDSVAAHYGFKDEDLDRMIRKCTGKIFEEVNWSDTIDVLFPNLDAEGRLRVYAFGRAMMEFEKYKDAVGN